MFLDLDPELVAPEVEVAILEACLKGRRKIGSYLELREAALVAAQSRGFSNGASVDKDTGRPSALTCRGVVIVSWLRSRLYCPKDSLCDGESLLKCWSEFGNVAPVGEVP